MKRRAMIKSILAAPIVGIKPKEELFVVETPDGYVSDDGGVGYKDTEREASWKPIPPGRWKLRRIVFEKVGE